VDGSVSPVFLSVLRTVIQSLNPPDARLKLRLRSPFEINPLILLNIVYEPLNIYTILHEIIIKLQDLGEKNDRCCGSGDI
jgi:hypothetical protein